VEDLTKQWLDEEVLRRRRSTCRSTVLDGDDVEWLGEGLGVIGGTSNGFVVRRGGSGLKESGGGGAVGSNCWGQ